MNNSKYNTNDVTLIITLSLALCEFAGDFAYIIMASWIMVALCKFALNRGNINNCTKKKVLSCFLQCNFEIKVIIYIYTMLLIILGLTQSRFFSSNMQTFINALSAISIVYIFGRKAFTLSAFSLVLAWVFCVLHKFFQDVGDFSILHDLEFHDLAFGTGYILLYYLYAKRNWKRSDIKFILSVLIIILLAFKRIGILGLTISIVMFVMLKLMKSEYVKRKLIYLLAIVTIIMLYVYVYLVTSGLLWNILEFVHINTMGRNYYYQVIRDLTEFNVSFLGLGRNACATLFTTDYSYMKVGNVHSDILRMYAECGFILFGIWLWNYWIRFLRKINNLFGYKSMEFMFICIIYTFVVYLTDNTELYLCNQYFFMLAPMSYILNKAELPVGNNELKK